MKTKFYHWLARWRMVRRYRYLIEVNKILEEYLTQQIIAGGSEDFIKDSRKQLLSIQGETKTHERFVNYLTK